MDGRRGTARRLPTSCEALSATGARAQLVKIRDNGGGNDFPRHGDAPRDHDGRNDESKRRPSRQAQQYRNERDEKQRARRHHVADAGVELHCCELYRARKYVERTRRAEYQRKLGSCGPPSRSRLRRKGAANDARSIGQNTNSP